MAMRARRVLTLPLAGMALLGAGGAESAITVLGNDAPSWSADGGRIAFTAFRHGLGEIYVMNADGSAQRRLTRNPAHDDHASWSPDGRRIAFVSMRAGNAEIYVMNADGTGTSRLTRDPRSDYLPTWSPDGTRIVWRSDRDGNAEIYVMNADGTDARRLTNDPKADTAPDWGPNGQIVFASNRAGTPFNIYVMNEDGSNVRRVTTSQQNHDQPDWSPNGTEIVFVEDRDAALGQADIFAVRTNGTGRRRITESEGRDDWPVYSPDGARLLFTRGLSFRTPEIFVANADGSRALRLTSSGPQLEVVDASANPVAPVAGRRWTTEIVVEDVRGAPLVGKLAGVCTATIGGVPVRLLSRHVDAGLVRCVWAIPRSARGKRVIGSIGLRVGKLRADLPFSLRVA
jgi:TolB protein